DLAPLRRKEERSGTSMDRGDAGRIGDARLVLRAGGAAEDRSLSRPPLLPGGGTRAADRRDPHLHAGERGEPGGAPPLHRLRERAGGLPAPRERGGDDPAVSVPRRPARSPPRRLGSVRARSAAPALGEAPEVLPRWARHPLAAA